MKRVSVDIGGTFTDCFLVFDDQYIEAKALTTHHNLANGFMEALAQAAESINETTHSVLSQVDSVRYATTLGTNALIERTGPSVGVLVTAGYESAIPLMRGRGYGEGLSPGAQADLPGARRPEPLVSIPLIRGLRERIDYRGTVVLPLDVEHLRSQVRTLIDRGARAFVVALVNSVMNPEHERLVEEVILDEYPSHLLGNFPVILSHQVGGRKGEYVRATSAILDAYLHDQMYYGLSALEMRLKESGYQKPMLVMHNTGGMAQLNSTHALQTIHSGPVAGVNASEHLGDQFDIDNIVTTDMGGTSFDIGIVVKGGIKFYDFNPVMDRWLVNVPMMHLETIGAGGGSIARFDRLYNTIEIGPMSAGSDPGPACYDRGGLLPTVTDADLILGYLDPEYYAGGHINLNRRRSEFAIEDELCELTGLSVVEVAQFIKQKVDTNMAHAISKELGAKGYDPRQFTLLAYGGNGPLHCCGIASALGSSQILIPPFSSVFSALGAGNMDQMHVHERSVFMWVYDSNTQRLMDQYETFNNIVAELENLGREDLKRQGLTEEAIQFRLELDMRYGNQLTQTSVVSPVRRIASDADLLHLIEAFGDDYGRRFGQGSQAPEAGIRINAIRVLSFVQTGRIPFRRTTVYTDADADPVGHRLCHFPGIAQPVETAVYRADRVPEGAKIIGPALIESPRTTYLVERDWVLHMDQQGAAWIRRV
ncbi:MAG: hydantoinase [Sulfobacillus benefaciens]|uniref:Hydantoinase n=1 Tax=Sulfobacillus benefaciens TaxID=453960 RepID=A0A2T2XIZ8_9FIRM|nr:MAG: hydantoinase [Sulfobacillus benefaciens]